MSCLFLKHSTQEVFEEFEIFPMNAYEKVGILCFNSYEYIRIFDRRF